MRKTSQNSFNLIQLLFDFQSKLHPKVWIFQCKFNLPPPPPVFWSINSQHCFSTLFCLHYFSAILSAVFVMWRWFTRKLKSSGSRTLLIEQPQLRYCHGPVKPADKTDNGCYQIVIALGKLGVIMAYFFLCDRY